MKLLKISLAFTVALLISLVALAEKHQECITFNGVEYCTEVQTVINIGSTVVPLSDPLSVLNAARGSDVKKIGLWDHYKMPEVVAEIARQVNLDPNELIDILAPQDSNWEALKELRDTYPLLASNLSSQISSADLERLFRSILNEISQDIIEQLDPEYGNTYRV